MSIAGLCKDRVTVQRATVTVGAFGGNEESWADHLTVNARVQPLSAKERNLYSRDTEVVTHKIYVPGNPDITASDRIQFRSKTYLIRGVRNIDEWDRFLTIEAEVQT